VWTVEAAGANGVHPFDLNVASDSYGEEFRAALQSQYAIGGGCHRADTNCDGLVDAFDIEPFIYALGGQPCAHCAGDINGDGVLDAFDIEPFIDCLLSQP
jgi:hypothetical protein